MKRLPALLRPYRWPLAQAVILGSLTVGASVGLMTTSAYLISMAALHPSIADLRVAIAGVRFFGISRGVFRYLERIVSHQVTFSLLTGVRVWFYRKLEPLAPARLLEFRSGDLLSRIVSDIETLENIYLQVIGPTLIAVIVALLVAWLMGSYNTCLAVVVVSIMAVSGLGVSWLTRALGRASARRVVSLRADLSSIFVDTIQGMADLLAFGRGDVQRERIKRVSVQLENEQARAGRTEGLGTALMSFATDAAVVASLWIAIPLVRSGGLEGVYLALVALGVMAAFEAIQPLPSAYQKLEESLASARRLFELIDKKPVVQEPVNPLEIPDDHTLVIQNLSFSYSAESETALEGLDLELAEGRCLAIVGPSGAGKTTLVHLLLRFWDYSSGSIRLGGRELKDMSPEDLRREMSVVSQGSYLFSGTIRENLLLARPSATEQEIIEASRRAEMHDFVQSLSDKYDTWIGERGLNLSGGERQRLAIARALLKDAPIVILDEPTANLDPLTERRLIAEFRRLLSGRTVLLVTHRSIGLDWADEILVLHKGRVVERGTERELVERKGFYRKMLDIQRGEAVVETLFNAGGTVPSQPA